MARYTHVPTIYLLKGEITATRPWTICRILFLQVVRTAGHPAVVQFTVNWTLSDKHIPVLQGEEFCKLKLLFFLPNKHICILSCFVWFNLYCIFSIIILSPYSSFPHNHHTVVQVHEYFFLFAQPLHLHTAPSTPHTLAVICSPFIVRVKAENSYSSCFHSWQGKPGNYGSLMWSRKWWSLPAGTRAAWDRVWDVGREQQEKRKAVHFSPTFYFEKIKSKE